jgi:thiol-disulfide isomerase/thioredoxin
LPSAAGGGASSKGALTAFLNLYRLDPTELPAKSLRYVGIEAVTPEGRRAIAARAVAGARAAGVEVLPLSRVGRAYDFVLTTLDGKKVRSRDLRGKVVLIDCWSTACVPCMEKMPALKALYQKHHPGGFEIIGVSLDTDAAKLRKVCQARDLTWPQVLVPADGKKRRLWMEATGGAGVPRLLLIDRAGILQADCPPDLGEEINRLMKEKAEKQKKQLKP